MTNYAPVSAMSVVTGTGTLAPVSAIPVVIISDGSVPIGPGTAQPVIEVASDYPRAPVQAIPIVYAGGSPAVAKLAPIPVYVVSGGGGGGWSALDGSLNAPTGAAQYPTLFSGYAARPPWQVAGVDYRVGVNTGVTLKDPSVASLPTGVSRAGTTFTVNNSDVTLDGWDFTQGAGWTVDVRNNNCTISNCRFSKSGAANLINSINSVSATNLTVKYCEMNGQNNLTDFIIDAAWPGLIIEYCYIHGSGSDLIGRNYNQNGGAVTIRWSLFEQAGMGGALVHGDYLQVYDPTLTNISITFTTSKQVGGITQGWVMDNAAAGEFAYNTMIGSCSYWVALDTLDITGVVTVHHNYFDITAASGFAYPGGGEPGNVDAHWNFHDNVNLVTGLPDENDDVTPPPTIAADNFNRTNGGLGSNWGTDRGTLIIVSNQVKGGSAVNCVSYRSAGTFTNNQYSQIVWQGGGNGAGPVVRHNSANPGSYYLSFFNGSSSINISKVTAGSYSTLSSIGGVGFNPGDVYRLEISGNDLSVKKNGVVILGPTTDASSPFTTGRPGFEVYDVNAIVDDWEGGNL